MGRTKVPLDLGSRLNKRRRDLGMSLAELARRTDLSRSHAESLMTGKRSPTPPVAEKLIAVLDLEDGFAAELRSLDGSCYMSGFAQGEILLTESD